MKKLSLLLMIFLLNGCLGSKAPITCIELSDEYNKYNHLENITLDTAKGFNELAEYMFIYDNTSKFNEDIDTYFLYLELFKEKSIDKPSDNRYCNSIDSTIKDENIDKVSYELSTIKDKWTEDYNENIINNLKYKIKFNEIDGCKENAEMLIAYILSYQIRNERNKNSDDMYNKLKKTYQECLDKSKEKK